MLIILLINECITYSLYFFVAEPVNKNKKKTVKTWEPQKTTDLPRIPSYGRYW